ncbi:MAG: class I SAM-dependent methyltransferase [Gemmataceae bacterium]
MLISAFTDDAFSITRRGFGPHSRCSATFAASTPSIMAAGTAWRPSPWHGPGARVKAFDLSPGYVAEARGTAAVNGVSVECVVADGENLLLRRRSLRRGLGQRILHHLDLAKAGRELLRALKPGGVAVFCEPWGGNPAPELCPPSTSVPWKRPHARREPLTRHDLAPLRAIFPSVEVWGFQLLGMVRRVSRNRLLCAPVIQSTACCGCYPGCETGAAMP